MAYNRLIRLGAGAAAAAALQGAAAGDPSPAVRKKASWYAPGGTIYRRTAPA